MKHHVCHLLHLPVVPIHRHNLRFWYAFMVVHFFTPKFMSSSAFGHLHVLLLFSLFFGFGFGMRKSRFPFIYQPLWFLRISATEHGKMFVHTVLFQFQTR